jgi:hypothetical protein
VFDDPLKEKTVQYFIVGLLAAVVIFLIFGLARDDGDSNPSSTQLAAVPATPRLPQQTVLNAQVGCQQPASGQPAKGKNTLPPNPGVHATKSGARGAVISVTIPTSTQECRVAKVSVQLDSTADKIPATTKTVSVITGPPVRKIKVTLAKTAGEPQIARASAITPDGRRSAGAVVAVR